MVFMKPFQITETPTVEKDLQRNQDRIVCFLKYFTEITLNQSPLPQIANQKDLSLNEMLN